MRKQCALNVTVTLIARSKSVGQPIETEHAFRLCKQKFRKKNFNYAKVKNRPACIVRGQKQGYFEKFRGACKKYRKNDRQTMIFKFFGMAAMP